MANFIGGSAPAMATQIVEGFTLMTAASIRGFSRADLGLLRGELDKLLREIRSQVPPQDDALAQQARNRKIARLSSAVQVLQHQLTAK
ncbi:MAG TPA: hypothetical protein VJU18_20185 [Vicinamibacteria bacterium]|nr:hypothetical protein [Vicinamibacteria bacterium]